MGDVVRLDTSVPPPLSQRWLRLGGRILGHLVSLIACAVAACATAILVLGLVFHGAGLSIGPGAAYVGPTPDLADVVPFGSLPVPTRRAYALTLVFDTAPVLFVLLHLRALLRLYAAGRVFGARHGRHVARVALGLCAYAAAPLCGHVLVAAAGHGVDRRWFDPSEIHALLLASVLLLVARVMDAGYEAQLDADGII